MSHLQDIALTTPDVVSAELGIPTHLDGAEYLRISRYVMAASDLFRRAVGYDLHYQEGLEAHVSQPRGERLLIVGSGALPIKEVHSVEYRGSLIDPEKYRLEDPEKGWITRTDHAAWQGTDLYRHGIRRYKHGEEKAYVVTYDGGYVTPYQAEQDESLQRDLPYDLEQAIVTYAVFLYQRAGHDQTVSSKSTGDWSIQYIDGVEVPPIFKAAVQRYQRVII